MAQIIPLPDWNRGQVLRGETPQFPSWEGLGVGPFPRFHADKGREISLSISRITMIQKNCYFFR